MEKKEEEEKKKKQESAESSKTVKQQEKNAQSSESENSSLERELKPIRRFNWFGFIMGSLFLLGSSTGLFYLYRLRDRFLKLK